MKKEWDKSILTISVTGESWSNREYVRYYVRKFRRRQRGRTIKAVLPPRKPPLIHKGRKP